MFGALLLSDVSMSALAQVSAFAQIGGNGVVQGYALPRTAIEVSIMQQREVLIRGPYSKYASKYLGVTGVAQSDKESYKILGATLGYSLEADPNSIYSFDSKSGATANVFNWLSPSQALPSPSSSSFSGGGVSDGTNVLKDKDYEHARIGMMTPFGDMGVSSTYGRTTMAGAGGGSEDDFAVASVLRGDAVEKTVEQMAAEAASAIFKLRKRRFELITGEQGENVFGQGLKAALSEIDRLETEYMSLFIGKRFTQNSVHKFVVAPAEIAKGRITVCRFSDEGGVTSDADVSGRPINIEFTPERSNVGGASGSDRGAGASGGGLAGVVRKITGKSVVFRVPRIDVVRLMDGLEMLTQERVPIYQFGVSAEAPAI